MQETEKLMLADLWPETGLVFTMTVGTPLDADNLVKRSFKPLLELSNKTQVEKRQEQDEVDYRADAANLRRL